jgi:hypothetical protein
LARPLDDLDCVDLLFWLRRWNRQLADHHADVFMDVDAARGLPLDGLRSVVAATAERVGTVTESEAWG